MTEVAAELLDRLVRTFSAARDPDRAAAQAAYMRDQFAYLGLASPAQRALARTVVAGLPKPAEDDLRVVALRCWELGRGYANTSTSPATGCAPTSPCPARGFLATSAP